MILTNQSKHIFGDCFQLKAFKTVYITQLFYTFEKPYEVRRSSKKNCRKDKFGIYVCKYIYIFTFCVEVDV